MLWHSSLRENSTLGKYKGMYASKLPSLRGSLLNEHSPSAAFLELVVVLTSKFFGFLLSSENGRKWCGNFDYLQIDTKNLTIIKIEDARHPLIEVAIVV